jgi:hypothetical protein
MDEKERERQDTAPTDTAVADPIQAMVEKIQAEGGKAHATFYEWAKLDRQRVNSEVPDTADFLLEGLRALMAFGLSRRQSIVDIKKAMEMARQLHMTAAQEYQRLQAEQGDLSAVSARAGHLANKLQELGATVMYIEHELQQIGGTFDVLTARFWGLYPACSPNGGLIQTLPMN